MDDYLRKLTSSHDKAFCLPLSLQRSLLEFCVSLSHSERQMGVPHLSCLLHAPFAFKAKIFTVFDIFHSFSLLKKNVFIGILNKLFLLCLVKAPANLLKFWWWLEKSTLDKVALWNRWIILLRWNQSIKHIYRCAEKKKDLFGYEGGK